MAKWMGIILGCAGGLSIGKEGPNIHMSAIICNQLMKMSTFKRIRENQSYKR